jgi:hypothetical protein
VVVREWLCKGRNLAGAAHLCDRRHLDRDVRDVQRGLLDCAALDWEVVVEAAACVVGAVARLDVRKDEVHLHGKWGPRGDGRRVGERKRGHRIARCRLSTPFPPPSCSMHARQQPRSPPPLTLKASAGALTVALKSPSGVFVIWRGPKLRGWFHLKESLGKEGRSWESGSGRSEKKRRGSARCGRVREEGRVFAERG